jgi:hypothetical protein
LVSEAPERGKKNASASTHVTKENTAMSTMARVKSMAAGGVMAGVLLVAPGFAYAQKITTDWDKTATFAAYKTYTLSKGQVPAGANPLMVQRVESGIKSELASLGLLTAETGGDLMVVYHASTKEDVSLQTTGYAPRWGGGTVNVNRILNGMLVVDVSDSKGKNLLWRATATDTVSDNPQKNEKKIQKAVEKMFEKYPTAPK